MVPGRNRGTPPSRRRRDLARCPVQRTGHLANRRWWLKSRTQVQAWCPQFGTDRPCQLARNASEIATRPSSTTAGRYAEP